MKRQRSRGGGGASKKEKEEDLDDDEDEEIDEESGGSDFVLEEAEDISFDVDDIENMDKKTCLKHLRSPKREIFVPHKFDGFSKEESLQELRRMLVRSPDVISIVRKKGIERGQA